MKKLSLIIPGLSGTPISAPKGVPTGGLFPQGQSYLAVLIDVLFLSAALFALFMIIRAGLNIIMSQGDKQKFQLARARVQYSIIGLIIIFLSFLAINLAGHLFGVKLIGP